MECYSAIKKKEILSFVTTWMDPEGMMSREISQTMKDKYTMISLLCGIKKTQLIETESVMVVARGWGLKEMGRSGSKGTSFQL